MNKGCILNQPPLCAVKSDICWSVVTVNEFIQVKLLEKDRLFFLKYSFYVYDVWNMQF